MSRLTTTFDKLKEQRRKALIPFITAGDPEPGMTVDFMRAMVDAGADIIELGVPFSDPMADGPVIQKATERALKHRVGMRQVFEMVTAFRQYDSSTPVVLMGYLNPVEYYGYERFAEDAGRVGIDGVLTVDMPPEEAEELAGFLRQNQIDPIFLLAPNSTPERIKRIGDMGDGYLYYVSLKGVTGAANLDLSNVESKVKEIREHATLPVAIGFGVKDAETAAQIGAIGDAVVVGSQLIRCIEQNLEKPASEISSAMTALLSGMRQAMDAQVKEEGAA